MQRNGEQGISTSKPVRVRKADGRVISMTREEYERTRQQEEQRARERRQTRIAWTVVAVVAGLTAIAYLADRPTRSMPLAEPTGGTAPVPEAAGSRPGASVQPLSPVFDRDKEAVAHSVRSWAAAWSQHEVDDHLAYYSQRFRSFEYPDRAAWETARRARIEGDRGPVSVRIGAPEIEWTAEGQARVVFDQIYRTPRRQEKLLKELVLELEGDQWRIVSERTLG